MRRIVAALGLVSVAACTDADLEPIEAAFDDWVELAGTMCTTLPEQASYPVRVLFAVDSSGSMIFNDPQDIHADAIQASIERFRPQENVSFGILRFGERKIVQELRDPAYTSTPVYFTKDETLLFPALTRMRQRPVENPDKYLGGTDYLGALEAIDNYIDNDLGGNQASGDFYQYYVIFLTDGMTEGGANPADTAAQILTSSAALVTGRPGRVHLNVISIVQVATVTEEFQNLLNNMAIAADGIHKPLNSVGSLDAALQEMLSEDLLLLEFDVATINTTSEPRSFIAVNRHLVLTEYNGRVDQYIDSDGDGVIDLVEKEIGSSPRDADTDNDGLDDFFEIRYLGEFDPTAKLTPGLTVDQLADADRDGLIAYVEERLGTTEAKVDFDGDNVSDGLEYRSGTNPVSDDMGADPDFDGVSNAFEVRQHSNPQVDEGDALHQLRSYRLSTFGTPTEVFDGRRCYDFDISNIAIAPTLAHVDLEGIERPAGYNRIDLWRIEIPVGLAKGGRVPNISRSKKGGLWVMYDPSRGVRQPVGRRVTVREYHFEP